ncbi:MAG: hypothetical protein ACTSRP_12265 [Candidatus Helarchaeota archaeon]
MSTNLSKDISEVIDILKMIIARVKASFNEIEEEIDNTFSLEVVKNAIKYGLDIGLLRITEIVNEELEKLKWIDIIVDCGEIDTDLEEIMNIILISKEKISEELSKIPDFSDFRINLNQITRKIHLQFPVSWGLSNIENLFKNMYTSLREKDIIPVS